MIEQTCFAFDRSESSVIKTGVKAGKTAQEIVEEYNPWKTMVEEIDAALAVENAAPQVEEVQVAGRGGQDNVETL